MSPFRVLEISGTPYELGYQHGKAYAKEIREIAEERLLLCSDETWTGRTLSRKRVLELAEACLQEHFLYLPELMQELEGMADATQLSLAELIIANGFTDFIDVIYNADATIHVPASRGNECTTFLVHGSTTNSGHGFLGQTWDMHASATPYVILLRGKPANAPEFLMFTITGCVGMIGMNTAGICIGINNLMGADGRTGVTWPFVCRKALMQTKLDDALNCILSANLAGAHNYLLMDEHGQSYNIEAMSTTFHIEELKEGALVHANRCLADVTREVERTLDEELKGDSATRCCRAEQLLQQRPITPETLMALTRDRSDETFSICSISEPPYFTETCGAVIMRPATREFWGVWGLPVTNEYERFFV